jgi:trigger factor
MSMQIVEKSGEGLSRVYGVTVPAADLTEKLEARIAEITPTLDIKGFRPGKVPPAHVRRMFGKALMSEVVEQTINETTTRTSRPRATCSRSSTARPTSLTKSPSR